MQWHSKISHVFFQKLEDCACGSASLYVPLTICIDQTRRALVIVLPCYGALEIVGVIIIIIIINLHTLPL